MEPLTDETICGVFSNEDLRTTMGFQTVHYSYRHSSYNSEKSVVEGGGHDYTCVMYSNAGSVRAMEFYYYPFDEIYIPAHYEDKFLPFDEIRDVFPDAVEPAGLDGHAGEGLTWTVGRSMYLAWRYPDGHTMRAQARSREHEPPTAEEVESFLTVMSGVLDEIPVVAAGPSGRVVRPDPSASASPSAG